MNVLVALAWPNHVHHDAARRWFDGQHRAGWATCPVTQSGFVRVSSNRKILPEARTPLEAIAFLGELTAVEGHTFWVDEVALATSDRVAPERIVGYRQVTDAHLVALALSRGGRVATFDRGMPAVAPGRDPARVVRVIH